MTGRDPSRPETCAPMPETSPPAQPTRTAADEPTAAELLEQFDRAIAEEEFDNYRSRQDEIRARFTNDIDRIRGELNAYLGEINRLRERLAGLTTTPFV